MKQMYCIFCEEIVPVEEPIEGHSVVEYVPDEGTQEIAWCEGPFAYSAPEFTDDWDTQDEPSPEELEYMDSVSEELLWDFEDY